MAEDKYRLITRSDFDGFVSAILLKELGLIDTVKFVKPRDVQNGTVEITGGDITTNLPYAQKAYFSFDHHISEADRVGVLKSNYMLNPTAPSAARVVWDSFGGKDGFPNISEEIMIAVDKADSANYTMEEVLNPTGWTLLSFIMDVRTGLSRFKDFRISNYQLIMDLVENCHNYDIEKILELPDLKERSDVYFAMQDKFKEQLKNIVQVHKNLGYIDLLDEKIIYPGNRFVVYTLFPEINVSMQALRNPENDSIIYAIGKSIFNKTNNVNIGALMLKYGGGGHKGAGTCQVSASDAAKVRGEIIDFLTDPSHNA